MLCWMECVVLGKRAELRSSMHACDDLVLMMRRERTTVNVQLLSDLCDITIPSFALSYGQGYLDDGLVGLAGTVSSLLGLTAQWRKTA